MHSVTGQRGGTLLHHGSERISRMCAQLGFGHADERLILDIFSRMASGWGHLRCGGRPRWLSDITDDHTPFELSVAIDGDSPELRLLGEIQSDLPTPLSNWAEALAFNDELASRFGVSLARFRQIEDLFAPASSSARFGAWHAVCFRPGARPDFKIYLNPAAGGRASARSVVETAMKRLGFGEAGAYLPPSTESDVLLYFSLDLAESERARVKAYTGHYNSTPEHVEESLRSARGYLRGQVAEFCRAMGGHAERYDGRPVQTCLAFTAGASHPTSGTVYFPVRSYADSDLEVRERIRAYLPPQTIGIYEGAVRAFANRPLEEGVGMQSYLSLRQGTERVTVYLSPEVYAVDRADRSGVVSGVQTRGTMKRVRQAVGQ